MNREKITFGNAVFAKKMAGLFGEAQGPVKAEMSYSEDVETFVKKIHEAHKQAYKSKVVFG